LLTEVSIETEDGNVMRSRLRPDGNHNEHDDMVNRTAEQLQKELSSFLSNDTIFQAAIKEEEERRKILEEVRDNGPNYMRQTFASAGRVTEKSRAGSPVPGRAQSPFMVNRSAVRSPSPRNRMPPTDLPLAERPWVPGGVLDLTVSNGAARRTSSERDGQTSTSERAQACCEALYHDAFERRERQSTLRQEAFRERIHQERAEREATIADINRSRRWVSNHLVDTRTREERDNELLAKREQLCRQAEAEERQRISNETKECTFKPMLVAEEKRRAPRKALEEPDKGRALTARQKKALGAMALLERSEAEETKGFVKERENVQAQMQREETNRVLSFLRTPEGNAFLRSRMSASIPGGAVSLSMRQAEIIEELVSASTAQVERRVEDVMRSRMQSIQSKLQYRRLRVLAELDAVHGAALQLPGFPPGFDEHAAARVRKLVDMHDSPSRPPSPGRSPTPSSVPRGDSRSTSTWARDGASPRSSTRPVPPPLKVPIIISGAYPTGPTSARTGSSLSYATPTASMGPMRRESPRFMGY
jgi:hypothetical protein